uniref:Protein PXR1-like n=1 Tax=Caenorhabditis tropicalis TaxID=1561998 RepID=A0A1I7TLZ2_9PELO
MQKCKYRKSCYEAAGITDKEEEKEKGEDMKTPHIQEKLKPVESSTDRHHHSKHGKKKHQEQKDSDEDNDSDEEEQEKPKKNKEEKKEEAKVHEQSDKETLEQGGKEISLSVAEKSWCKYRKSCYSSVEPKAAKQDHSGSMARRAGSGQKCHIYYLSCREAMGLSPKEKAPMGPNGKRLCRKVKKDN